MTWRSWTIRMRKSVGTTTTSLYTSRVLHLGDIIVVNTNVCFHSFVVNKYIFYCLSLNYKARQVDKLRANNRHEESNIVWESSFSCTDIEVCLCWQQQVWWLPYQVERRHCQDAEMRETEDNQTEQKEHLSLNNTGYNNVLNATKFFQKR